MRWRVWIFVSGICCMRQPTCGIKVCCCCFCFCNCQYETWSNKLFFYFDAWRIVGHVVVLMRCCPCGCPHDILDSLYRSFASEISIVVCKFVAMDLVLTSVVFWYWRLWSYCLTLRFLIKVKLAPSTPRGNCFVILPRAPSPKLLFWFSELFSSKGSYFYGSRQLVRSFREAKIVIVFGLSIFDQFWSSPVPHCTFFAPARPPASPFRRPWVDGNQKRLPLLWKVNNSWILMKPQPFLGYCRWFMKSKWSADYYGSSTRFPSTGRVRIRCHIFNIRKGSNTPRITVKSWQSADNYEELVIQVNNPQIPNFRLSP